MELNLDASYSSGEYSLNKGAPAQNAEQDPETLKLDKDRIYK